MAFRVGLIIDGDQKNARIAVDKTVKDLEQLGAKAQGISQQTAGGIANAGKLASDSAGKAAKLTGQQLAQMQFQLQDIAVGLASGQSPFTVMMQQGSQLAQSFQSGTGVIGALKAVGGGIVSFITNPLNLAVIGFGLVATAAGAVAAKIMESWPSANALIEQHESLVQRIGKEWDIAAGKVKNYSLESRSVLLFDALGNQQKLRQAFEEAASGLVFRGRGGASVAGVGADTLRGLGNADLDAAVKSLMDGVVRGKADIYAFRDAIAAVSNASDDPRLKQFVQTMLENSAQANELQRDWEQNQQILKGLSGDQKAMNEALGQSASQVAGLTGALSGLGKGAGEAFAAAQRSIGGVLGGSPATGGGKPAAPSARGRRDLTDEQKQLMESDSRWAAIIANLAAERLAEAEAIGKTAEEQRRLKVEEQLWAQARGVYGDRLEKDKALHDRLAEAIRNEANAQAELANRQEQADARRETSAAEFGRIADMRRDAQDQEARRLENIRGIASAITSSFFATLEQTRSLSQKVDAMLDAMLAKASEVLDKLLNKLMFGEGDDGGLFGGFLDSIFKFDFGGGTPTADLYSAAGNVFAPAGVTAFAGGGAFSNRVISQPTMFRFGGNRLGIMGEAGEEAVMPMRGRRIMARSGGGETSLALARMANGSLGVSLPQGFADGGVFGGSGSGAGRGPVINNTVRNYGNAKVSTSASQRTDGTIDIDTVIDEAVDRRIAMGRFDNSLQGRYDMQRRVGQYG